jgi:hypothetical protein
MLVVDGHGTVEGCGCWPSKNIHYYKMGCEGETTLVKICHARRVTIPKSGKVGMGEVGVILMNE